MPILVPAVHEIQHLVYMNSYFVYSDGREEGGNFPIENTVLCVKLHLKVAVVQKFRQCSTRTDTAYTMTGGRKAVICNCNSGSLL